MINAIQGSGLQQRLLQLGIVLFLLGLLTGFAIPLLANARMGLSSHIQGVLNGVLLIVLGLVWPKLNLSRGSERLAFGLAVYGTFANWLATLLAAIWNTGAMMPIASGGAQSDAVREAVVGFLLLSLSAAMVALCAILLWGLRSAGRPLREDTA